MNTPGPIIEHQEKLLKLAHSDAEQLKARVSNMASSRAKSIFITNLETAMLWLEKAVAETGVESTEEE